MANGNEYNATAVLISSYIGTVATEGEISEVDCWYLGALRIPDRSRTYEVGFVPTRKDFIPSIIRSVTANFFFFLIKISRVNVFIDELRANHKNLEIFDFNHISRLFTSHGMHLRVPGKRLFAKLIIEALLMINIPVCNPSSSIMASSADKPPSTTGPVAAAELHLGAKSSSDANGPSDDA
ncbi:hypothetical protein J6590_082836 [Homalodisca vitripennis]|nr:hypothetical protein J6590_082836 [Homalodisca vitripennis]